MEKLDATMFGVSEEFIVPMLIAVLLCSLVAGLTIRRVLHNKAADNKVASGKIATTNDLPYNKTYDAGTVAAFIVSCATGICSAPAVVDATMVNAGLWAHVIVAGLIAMVLTVVLTYVFHVGLRVFIVQAKDYIVGLIKDVTDAKTEIEAAVSDAKKAVKKKEE